MNRMLSIISFLLIPAFVWAQLPSTSITLFEIDLEAEMPIKNGQYLTGFNPKGYNNQPAFFENDILYLTSDWNAKGQTDFIKLNLKSKTLTKVTNTEESEYSPTLSPDKRSITCISVPPGQNGQNQTQLLWKYPINRENIGDAISYDIENVGYHYWLNRTTVAMFLVGDPHRLVIMNTLNGDITDVDTNVGRCFKLNSDGNLLYVYKAAHNIWYLKTYNLETGRKSIVGETKTGSEDFDFLSDGSLIMGQGSELYKMSEVGGWQKVADLKEYGVDGISRIAVKNNKIALVHAS